MSTLDQAPAEKTYRAIGRFMFEFSQVEFSIRYYLAEEIGLKDEYFSAVIESYDVTMLCNVAIEVFAKHRAKENADCIKTLIDRRFRDLYSHRNRIAHGLWVPFKEGGTVIRISRDHKRTIANNQADVLERQADEACAVRAELESAFMEIKIPRISP
jgi:hypothetical protein